MFLSKDLYWVCIYLILFFFSFMKLYIYIPVEIGVAITRGTLTIEGDWMIFLGSFISWIGTLLVYNYFSTIS